MQVPDWIYRYYEYDDLCARLQNCRRTLNVGWLKFCRDLSLDPKKTQDAIKCCELDFRPHLPLLQILAQGLGRDLTWLLTGIAGDSPFVVDLRERVHQYVEEYIRRDEVPIEDRGRLHAYVQRMIDNLGAPTPTAAYRRDLPESWQDVGWIYEDMLAMEG